MVMMTIISAMIIITKYSLPTIDFATRYSLLYSVLGFFATTLLEPYSESKKATRWTLPPCNIVIIWSDPPKTAFLNVDMKMQQSA